MRPSARHVGVKQQQTETTRRGTDKTTDPDVCTCIDGLNQFECQSRSKLPSNQWIPDPAVGRRSWTGCSTRTSGGCKTVGQSGALESLTSEPENIRQRAPKDKSRENEGWNFEKAPRRMRGTAWSSVLDGGKTQTPQLRTGVAGFLSRMPAKVIGENASEH